MSHTLVMVQYLFYSTNRRRTYLNTTVQPHVALSRRQKEEERKEKKIQTAKIQINIKFGDEICCYLYAGSSELICMSYQQEQNRAFSGKLLY